MFVFIFVTVFVTMFSLAAPANYGSYWIYLDLRLTRWRSWESSARVTAHISAPLNLEMWPGCPRCDPLLRSAQRSCWTRVPRLRSSLLDAPEGPRTRSCVPLWHECEEPFGKIWELPCGEFHGHGAIQNIPKWVVYFMENPTKIDDLGVSLFQETTMCLCVSHVTQFTRDSFTIHISLLFAVLHSHLRTWGKDWSAGFEEMFDSTLSAHFISTPRDGFRFRGEPGLLHWGPTGPFEERHAECLRHQLWRSGSNLSHSHIHSHSSVMEGFW